MSVIEYAWSDKKNKSNYRKHRVWFEEGSKGRSQRIWETLNMKKKYDFASSKKNPYAKRLKKQVTMLMDKDVIDYFKKLSSQTGLAYQVLINLYLLECTSSKKKPKFKWSTAE